MPRVSKKSVVEPVAVLEPVPEPVAAVEKKPPATRKTFKAMSEENKTKLAEHAKTASKYHIASMRANLMLGKSWEEAHAKATEMEKKRTM
jgi:hypothetical protein